MPAQSLIPPFAHRPLVIGRRGMVAAGHPLAALADLSLASRVEAALASDPRTRGAVLIASCRQRRVLVTGGVYSETSKRAVEEIARAVPGVAGVQIDLYIEPIAWGLS